MPPALPRALLLVLVVVAARWLPLWGLVALFGLPLLAYGLLANRTRRHAVAGARVLVTGASSGLGRALAHEAARRGASAVILVARRVERLEAVADEIRGFAPACTPVVLPCDLLDPEAIATTLDAVVEEHGTPDIVVNNAGAGAWEHIEESTAEAARRMVDVPMMAAVHVTRVLAPRMITRRRGHVLCVTSAASVTGLRAAVVYGAARWGVRGLAWNLRADLAGRGIGVTLLNAAEVTDTEYFAEGPGRAGAQSHSRLPMVFQHPAVKAVSYTSAQTAVAAWDAVEGGTFEALVPGYMLWPIDVLNALVPDAVYAVVGLGDPGKR